MIHKTLVFSLSATLFLAGCASNVSQPLTAADSSPQPSANVTIASPTADSTSTNDVEIAASTTETSAVSLQILDNGVKLGIVPQTSVRGIYVLPSGAHVLTVQAVDSTGAVVDSSDVSYTVAEDCTNGRNQQCDLDQLPINNVQNDCSPSMQVAWVANSCGVGVQGTTSTDPLSTSIEAVIDKGVLPNQGNLSLNGHSVHFSEVQGTAHPSSVLFRGQSPTQTPVGVIDSHWTLSEYIYLPNPAAHQALEIDAQYTAGGIWTKFYSECAFNKKKGTGYWAVYDSNTGGWIYLNGVEQGGQTPPLVACNKSQFAQPWAGSADPSFTGWHHIVWTYLRNVDGTVTYQTLTFDGATTQVNFTPISATGGAVKDSGYFGALNQLNGVVNTNGLYDLVDAYVSEISFTHTP